MNLMEIGEMVLEQRRQLGMTQVELAEKSEVSRTRIIQLERGEIFDMRFSNLLDILQAVGLTLKVGSFNADRPVYEDLVAQKDDLYDSPGMG